MSQVKRWGTPDWREWNRPRDRGMYVLSSDHVAAMAEEREKRELVYLTGRIMGTAETIDDAREAVIVATAGFGISVDDPVVVAILAAIHALRGGE